MRLTVLLLAGMIAFSVLAIGLGQDGTGAGPLTQVYSPEIVYLFHLAGLTDIYHSGWFMLTLGLLFLNLLCVTIDRLPPAWRETKRKAPPAISLEQIKTGKKAGQYVYLELESAVGREQFRELVAAWCRTHVGPHHVLEDEGGLNELQIAVEHGRYSRVAMYAAHFALALIVAGAALNMKFGFSGQMSVNEGARTSFLQIFKGNNQGWPVYRDHEQAIPGFHVPGFEVELSRFDVSYYPGTAKPRTMSSWLGFYEDGKLQASKQAAVNRPASYRGLTFVQADFSRTGELAATLGVFDRKSEDQEALNNAIRGTVAKIGDTQVRVLGVQQEVEDLGAAVQLETTEGSQPTERFWVFERYPGFDPVHRKKSRYYFVLKSVTPRFSSSLLVSKEPGEPVVWAGVGLLVLFLFYSLLVWHNRYWFIWSQGRVTIVGWSERLALFGPRFARAMEKFKSRLYRVDRTMKVARTEVSHGAV